MPNKQVPTTINKSEKVTWSARPLFRRILLLGIIPLIAVGGGVGYWLHGGRYVSTENAYVKTDIAKLASEVSGRTIQVRAHAYMKVNEGDVLVVIDPRPFKLAVLHAAAELDAARQEVEILAMTLKEARTELREAEDRAAYFRKRSEREKGLVKRGIIPHTRFDELENAADAADGRVALARHKIQRIMSSLGGGPDQPVDAHPLVRAKIAVLEQAMLDLERTAIKAPASGTVVTVPLVSGEQVMAFEPILAIVTDTPPWVDANFKETELTYVRVGQKATVVLDIYPDVIWDAEVQSVSPATGAEFAILPPQNASGNWVKVVQRLPVRLRLLPPPDAPPLRAGLTAKATIDTKRERSLSNIFGAFSASAKSWW